MATAAQNRRGIIAMTTAMSLFCCNDALMKLAREAFPTGQAVALRTAFAIVVGIITVAMMGDMRKLPLGLRPLVLGRGIVEALCALTFIWALGLLPLANITAIVMASPLLIVLLAVLLRTETVGWRRTMALMVGFIGVLIVMRPSTDGFSAAALIALAGAGLVAIRDLTTRFISSDIPSTVVSLTSTVIVGALSLGLGMFETWQSPWRIELLYLGLAALLVTAGGFCIISAFRNTDVGIVAGYRYSVVPIAVLIGWLVWGETPDRIALAGIALIVGSGLYTLHRQRIRHDSQLKPEGDKPL
ncbi:Permease of the drug/metabolite transporter (DMT) superfamily [Bosea sp. CRIB-10]|uniref:DMT family transporter n=1 Tax=Bosea sp. CRIB-10 TaxID=378404 RepID=UPI0008E70A74|nr:DMT family transporter [Bosea sp. CRIB-10]SFC28320.1 Permease of the drug/metabolite transporter (DMT) superfamily [Bosea sp. CRIB-10]